MKSLSLTNNFQEFPQAFGTQGLMFNGRVPKDATLHVKLSKFKKGGDEPEEVIITIPVGAYTDHNSVNGRHVFCGCYFFAEKVEMKLTNSADNEGTIYYEDIKTEPNA